MRIGIVGAGGMGNVHARHYRRIPGVEIRFFDLDAERTAAFAARHEAAPAPTWEALLETCDAIDVCLPTDLHTAHALDAVAAGRPVLVEKPLARTLEEARKLRDAASAPDSVVMPAHVVRFFPDFDLGRRMVQDGAVGRAAAARTYRGGRAPGGGAGWFMDHSRSGGVLVDLAVHDFDWLRWTLGEVEAVTARSIAADRGSGPDHGLATLKFASGVIAHVEASWLDPAGFRAAFEVAGSEGLIEYDSRQNAGVRTLTAAGTTAETPLDPADDPYYRQLSAFVAAARREAPPPVTAEDGFAALAIALAALESAQTGRTITPSR